MNDQKKRELKLKMKIVAPQFLSELEEIAKAFGKPAEIHGRLCDGTEIRIGEPLRRVEYWNGKLRPSRSCDSRGEIINKKGK